MTLNEMEDKIHYVTQQYVGLGNIIVVDKDGNELNEVIFDIENNKLILCGGKKNNEK